jgi:Ion channel
MRSLQQAMSRAVVSRGRRWRAGRDDTGAYGVVLLSILVTIIATAALGRSPWGRWFVAALQGATLMLTLRLSRAKPQARLLTFVGVTLGLTVAAVAVLLGDDQTSRTVAGIISGLLAVGAPIAIVRGARGHVEVTAQTVMAALSVYLLIGLFFAFAYEVVAVLGDGPFFASGTDGAPPDHIYFSYSTLATIGFGDLTARGDIGRMASVLEGLLGQLYLVTVVAVLVSQLGSRRAR